MIEIVRKKLEKGSHELDADKIKTVTGKVDLIDQIVSEYSQKKWSRLHEDIQTATKLDKEKSKFLAERACKIFAFWIELYSKGIVDRPFSEFFSFAVANKIVSTEFCQMLVEQKKAYGILRASGLLGIPMNYVEIFNLSKFKEYRIQDNWIGTIRIETAKDKFHSITAYNLNGAIKISDISYRGIRVDPWKYVTPENFRYFTTFLKEAPQ